MQLPPIPGFRAVPKTGVIYVMTEAAKHGFHYEHPAWANLGQGRVARNRPYSRRDAPHHQPGHRPHQLPLFRYSGQSRPAAKSGRFL